MLTEAKAFARMWFQGASFEEALRHVKKGRTKCTVERIAMTTVVIGRNGKVYDLGKGEFPGDQYLVENGKLKKKLAVTMVENAFTCTQEEADRMKAGTLDWRNRTSGRPSVLTD